MRMLRSVRMFRRQEIPDPRIRVHSTSRRWCRLRTGVLRTALLRSLWRTPAAMFLALAALPAAAQNQLWVRQLGTSNADWAYAAAPDASGGVYVSGRTSGSLGGSNSGLRDAWLARYDGAGNPLWVRQLGTSADDEADAVAPDVSGGVYVSGDTFGSLGGPNAGSSDAWLARYDSAGNQLWARQLGTSTEDYARAAAPDGSGGVYVTGYTWGSLGGPNAGQADIWLARYDGAGNQLWIRQFGTNGGEAPLAAAPDASGRVYVSGYTTGSFGGPNAGNFDAWLAHYDGSGNQLWIRQLGTSANDFARAAAPDAWGGVYMSGDTLGSLGGPNAGSGDAWLARYDSAGNQLWIRQFGTNTPDVAYAAAPDGSGGVYVSGGTAGSLGGPFAGGYSDAWLARYDGAGNQLWVHQLGTSVYEDASAAAPDGSGGVYVSGVTWGSLGGPNAGINDAWLARYDDCGVNLIYCNANELGRLRAVDRDLGDTERQRGQRIHDQHDERARLQVRALLLQQERSQQRPLPGRYALRAVPAGTHHVAELRRHASLRRIVPDRLQRLRREWQGPCARRGPAGLGPDLEPRPRLRAAEQYQPQRRSELHVVPVMLTVPSGFLAESLGPAGSAGSLLSGISSSTVEADPLWDCLRPAP
jgi:hypothetical protein